jgi:hypothetical protein
MTERLKFALTILAATLALGLAAQRLEAAQESTATGGTESPPQQRAAAEKETGTSVEDAESGLVTLPPSNGMKTLDALAVRPTTFVSALFSSGAFVLSLPFAALDPALNVKEMRKNLVDYPFGDTFKRPLGDFDYSAW